MKKLSNYFNMSLIALITQLPITELPNNKLWQTKINMIKVYLN